MRLVLADIQGIYFIFKTARSMYCSVSFIYENRETRIYTICTGNYGILFRSE